MTRQSHIIRLLIACLMILAGSSIYVLFRDNIFFFKFIPETILKQFSPIGVDIENPLVYCAVFCLPDGLWYASFLLFESSFLDESKISKLIYVISALMPFAWECLQLCPQIPGTFDPYDIVTYLIILLLFIVTNNFTTCKNQKNF